MIPAYLKGFSNLKRMARVSFLKYLFLNFVLDIHVFTFLYFAKEESDNVIGGSTDIVKHSFRNISRNITQ